MYYSNSTTRTVGVQLYYYCTCLNRMGTPGGLAGLTPTPPFFSAPTPVTSDMAWKDFGASYNNESVDYHAKPIKYYS